MFSWFRQWNKFENRSIFDEVKAYEGKASKTVCQLFWATLYSGAVVTNKADVQPKPQQPKPVLTDLQVATIQPHVALICRLNGLQLRIPCKYMGYYSITGPGGMEGWVGLYRWPIAYSLPTKLSSVNHIDRAQGRKSPPAKDEHPNHWATPTALCTLLSWQTDSITINCDFVFEQGHRTQDRTRRQRTQDRTRTKAPWEIQWPNYVANCLRGLTTET